jgi:hypothetical protein
VDITLRDEITKLITHAIEVDVLDDEQIATRIMERYSVERKDAFRYGNLKKVILECFEAGFSDQETQEYVRSMGYRGMNDKSLANYVNAVRRKEALARGDTTDRRTLRRKDYPDVTEGRTMAHGELRTLVWHAYRDGKTSFPEVYQAMKDQGVAFNAKTLRGTFNYVRKVGVDHVPMHLRLEGQKHTGRTRKVNPDSLNQFIVRSIRAGKSRAQAEAEWVAQGKEVNHKSFMELYSKRRYDIRKAEGTLPEITEREKDERGFTISDFAKLAVLQGWSTMEAAAKLHAKGIKFSFSYLANSISKYRSAHRRNQNQ